MYTGTSHFTSFETAVAYYKDYGFDASDVRRKLDDGEIHIGKPTTTDNQKLKVNDEGRYVIADIARSYEVHIQLSDGNMAVMLKTRDKGEAETYADQLRRTGKYRRNLIRVVEFVNEGRGL
jgi:hypothetical protein